MHQFLHDIYSKEYVKIISKVTMILLIFLLLMN